MAEPRIAELLSPVTLARIDNFSLLARTVVEGFISGLHRSLYHGFGSEFFQYRSYVSGDDLKYVDWKVFGRRNKFYTKVFQQETNMNCCLVLDASASMDYQGSRAPCSKHHYAAMIAACLAYLANRQGDNVGLYVYADSLKSVIHPGRRSGGLQRVMNELQRVRAEGMADHQRALNYVGDHFRRRGMVVWISDFQGAEDELGGLIRRFRFRHHETIALQILDADELDLPFSRTTRFVDSETRAEIATAPDRVRAEYGRAMAGFLERVRSTCLHQHCDYLLARTNDDLGNLLAAYLHRREALS